MKVQVQRFRTAFDMEWPRNHGRWSSIEPQDFLRRMFNAGIVQLTTADIATGIDKDLHDATRAEIRARRRHPCPTPTCDGTGIVCRTGGGEFACHVCGRHWPEAA